MIEEENQQSPIINGFAVSPLMLIFGSCATEASEPGQILTEAALRKIFRVPWERLEGVNG